MLQGCRFAKAIVYWIMLLTPQAVEHAFVSINTWVQYLPASNKHCLGLFCSMHLCAASIQKVIEFAPCVEYSCFESDEKSSVRTTIVLNGYVEHSVWTLCMTGSQDDPAL